MDEDESRTGSEDALVSLSIEPETLSFSEIEAILGRSAAKRQDPSSRNWIAEFGRSSGNQHTSSPPDATLNASLARLEKFLEAHADQLSTVASGANLLVMITWTIHIGASPVTMTPDLIKSLGALNAVVWMDGYGNYEHLY